MRKLIGILVLGFGICTAAWPAPCTQTLSTGANIATAISGAANGSTICLNSGDYGEVSLVDIARTGFVTVRSVSGQVATISPQIYNSRNIIFDSLTIGKKTALIKNCAKNIEIRNSNFTGPLGITNYGYTCSNYPLNIVITNNTIPDVGQAVSEGRLDIQDKDGGQGNMGITVSNNTISGGCNSDGVQITGGASGVTITRNLFDYVHQSGTVHCDAIQIYGSGASNSIISNWFKNCSSVLQNAGASSDTILKNNVFQNGDNSFNSDFDGTMNIEHNTIYHHNTVFQIGPQKITDSSTSAIIKNNLFSNNSQVTNFETKTCSDCTKTNNLSGAPTFVGGADPGSFDTFSDWQLTSQSFGKGAATDGADLGAITDGISVGVINNSVVPGAPSNLHVGVN